MTKEERTRRWEKTKGYRTPHFDINSIPINLNIPQAGKNWFRNLEEDLIVCELPY